MANQHDLCIQCWQKHVLYDNYANIKCLKYYTLSTSINKSGACRLYILYIFTSKALQEMLWNYGIVKRNIMLFHRTHVLGCAVTTHR